METTASLLEIEFSTADLRKIARREGVMWAGELRKRELARRLAVGGFTVQRVREALAQS